MCGSLKRQAACFVFERGMQRAHSRGEVLRFITLTDGSGGEMDMAGLYAAWNRLRTRLRKSGHLHEYAAVVETTKNGALHLHVVATGRYIRQRTLSAAAEAAGFGRVVHIKAIKKNRTIERTAGYLSKYLAKQHSGEGRLQDVADQTKRRLRPVRTSRGWGISMREAEKAVIAGWIAARGGAAAPVKPAGLWIMITRDDEGDLRVWKGREEVDSEELAALLVDAEDMAFYRIGFRTHTIKREALGRCGLACLGLPPPPRPPNPPVSPVTSSPTYEQLTINLADWLRPKLRSRP